MPPSVAETKPPSDSTTEPMSERIASPTPSPILPKIPPTASVILPRISEILSKPPFCITSIMRTAIPQSDIPQTPRTKSTVKSVRTRRRMGTEICSRTDRRCAGRSTTEVMHIAIRNGRTAPRACRRKRYAPIATPSAATVIYANRLIRSVFIDTPENLLFKFIQKANNI